MSIRADLIFLVVLCAISFLPSFAFVAFRMSSLAIGLIVASAFTSIVTFRSLLLVRVVRKRYFFTCFGLYSLLLLSSLMLAVFYGNVKPISSISSISIIGIAAYGLALHLNQLSPKKIKMTIWYFVVILLFLGWMKLVYIPSFFNYQLHEKATFPFSEESHYALVSGFIFCIYAFIGDRNKALFILANSLALALLYPSLSILVYTFLLGFILAFRMPRLYFRIFLFLICPIFVLMALALIGNVEYFSSRLDFRNLDNLTALVFAQGWQLAYLNFMSTNGMGLGFQMLGSEETVIGSLTYGVMRLASGGRALNLSDGGFLAAKVIAEFGFWGLMVLAVYVVRIAQIPFMINNMFNSIARKYGYYSFLRAAVLFSFIPEVFLRGYGYFSPGVFFVLAVMFMGSFSRDNHQYIVGDSC